MMSPKISSKTNARETNRRKLIFLEEAREVAKDLPDDFQFDEAWDIYKMDCLNCTLHDVSNPKSVNCRDNPYCIKRLGLEKFEKLMKQEKSNSDKIREEQKRRDRDEIPCGLTNSGNFCYVNSFLQVWFNDPVFRQIIFDWRPSPSYEKPTDPRLFDSNAVMSSLQQLFFTLETTPFEDTDANKHFTTALRLNNEQQDAQEFTLKVFDSVDRNLMKHAPFHETARRIRERYTGSVRQRIWCSCGGKDNTNESPCTSLQLIIEGKKTLHEAIDAYFAAETLEDYRCDACDEKGNVQRQTIPALLPPVLMLSLNRYVFDASGRRKLKSAISYPRELPASLLNANETWHYDLFAVMIHEGDNLHSGHYYDLVKHPVNGKWFKFNDEHVEAIQKPPGVEKGKQTVSRPPVDMKACYALLYRKREPLHPMVYPPPEITDPWTIQNESKFVEDTSETMMKTERRLLEVSSRLTSLNQLFESLTTHADRCKKPRDVAFLPTNLLVDILSREYARAENITDQDDKDKIQSNGKDVDMVDVTDDTIYSNIEEDIPVKKKRGRPAVTKIPREHIAQLLSKHEIPICSHNKILIDTVLFGEVKAVNRQAAETLLSRYAITVKERTEDGLETKRNIFTGDDICMDCVRTLKREALFKVRLDEDSKLASKIIKESKTRCSTTATPKPANYFYVSRKALLNFKKLATKENEYQKRLQTSTSTMVFQATAFDPSTSSPEKSFSSTPKKARISRRTMDSENIISLGIEKEAEEEESVLTKMDVEDAVKEIVSNLSKEKNELEAETQEENEEDEEKMELIKNGKEYVEENGAMTNGYESRDEKKEHSSTPNDAERPSSSNSTTTSNDNIGPIEFNSELKCKHDGVNLDQFRNACSPEEWDALTKYYFVNTFVVSCTDPICPECIQVDQALNVEKKEMLATLKKLSDGLSEMLRNIEKRDISDIKKDIGGIYTKAVCSVFIKNLRQSLRNRGNHAVPTICQNCVLCEHGRPRLPIIPGEDIKNEATLVPITDKEWDRFMEEFQKDSQGVFPTPIIICADGEVEDLCHGCYADHMDVVKIQKYIYENKYIYVKLQSEETTPAVESIAPTKSRRALSKQLFKIKMSSSESIKDLKIHLYKETGQSPIDQLLYKEEGGDILDGNDMSLFEAKIIPDNQDRPLILIVATMIPNQINYDEQRAPERGFIDTALAH